MHLGILYMHSIDSIRNKKISKLVSLFKAGDMSLVIPQAHELIEKYKSGTAYNILALAYKKLGNYGLAQELYEKLLVSNPKNTVFLGNLGNIYNDVGKLDRAEECFKKKLGD